MHYESETLEDQNQETLERFNYVFGDRFDVSLETDSDLPDEVGEDYQTKYIRLSTSDLEFRVLLDQEGAWYYQIAEDRTEELQNPADVWEYIALSLLENLKRA